MSLMTKEQVAELKIQMGERAFNEMPFRRSGQSTAIAFRAIADAMELPMKTIHVRDHYDTRESNKYLMRIIIEIVDVLELEYFKFNHSKFTMMFNYDIKEIYNPKD